MSKQDVVIGLAVGVALTALAPVAILIAAGGGRRSLMRAFARGGQVLSEKARETFAEFQEITEDLVAEMRSPNEAVAAGTVAGATAGSPSSPSESAPPSNPGHNESTAT